MTTNSFKYIFIILTGVFILALPKYSLAAEVSFEVVSNADLSDQSTIIEVRINPEGKKLNVVEGVIILGGTLASGIEVGVETGGSLLALWPTSPNYDVNNKRITFVGGSPNGFSDEGLLFRMRVLSSLSGQLSVEWASGRAYLADGSGTQESINSKPVSIYLEKKEVSDEFGVSKDVTPPVFQEVFVGKDENAYNGKYFISFYASDDISGISKYEVTENGVITIVTDGVYIFKDQSRKAVTTITVYDQAGNKSFVEVPARFSRVKNVTVISLVVILFIIALRYGLRKFSKK